MTAAPTTVAPYTVLASSPELYLLHTSGITSQVLAHAPATPDGKALLERVADLLNRHGMHDQPLTEGAHAHGTQEEDRAEHRHHDHGVRPPD